VEVCLRRISWDLVGICLWWIRLNPVFVRICLCIYRLDHFDLLFSSSAAFVVLVRWSFTVLAQRLSDCLPQGFSISDDGGAKRVARLRLASVLVDVVRWSTNLAWCSSARISLTDHRITIVLNSIPNFQKKIS
jgi:hypothetical protein